MLRPGQTIAIIVLCLLTFGVVMVNSADMRVALVGSDQPVPELTAAGIVASRPTIYMVLAMAALTVGSLLPVRRLACGVPTLGGEHDGFRPLALATLAILLICGLVYVPGLAPEINGARRWLRLPMPGLGDSLSVQPSEIAKWAMVVVVAWAATIRARFLGRFWLGLVPILVAVGIVSVVIVKEDLGTGALVGLVGCVMLLAAGARFWHFMVFVPFAGLGLAYAIMSSDYRMKRIMAFSDPYADPEGIGYHTIQSLAAIANGEGFGRGLGHGLQKFGYLPEARTDFIFAVICEELGIAGAALVCALFIGLTWAGCTVARRERDMLPRLIVLGVTATVAIQAVINLMVVTGLAPTKGIALPLLSSGGTGWILTSFCLGLVISIDRTQHAAEELPAPVAA
ncbi:MAG: FtsW/RodA/SpoVE family cell cycle protein [Phycisphaerales bacterium]|nr:FtsW/RodA/SpoVE family cell cycle protein [Phycisphaerales bacterium]